MSIPPVAIITGAGSGIGRALCLLLADEGYRLALVGRTEAKLEETITQLAEGVANPTETLVLPADLSDAEQAMSVVDLTVQQWGRVDVLVNNAAIAPLAPIADTSAELLYQTFAANVFGPFQLVARLWPVFTRQRSGAVVNVSSMSAVDPSPGLSVYGASKAAVEGLTRSILSEGRELGIRAFSVAPGAVETPMLRAIFPDVPAARTLDPFEVAQVIADCVLGKRDRDIGRSILVPSP